MSYSSRRDILNALNHANDDVSPVDGHDYSAGELEAQAASIKSLQRFCIRLSKALIVKGLFTKKEMIDLIFKYAGSEWTEFDPSSEELKGYHDGEERAKDAK